MAEEISRHCPESTTLVESNQGKLNTRRLGLILHSPVVATTTYGNTSISHFIHLNISRCRDATAWQRGPSRKLRECCVKTGPLKHNENRSRGSYTADLIRIGQIYSRTQSSLRMMDVYTLLKYI